MNKRKYNDVGTHYIGDIQLKDKVYVIDPCYDITTWCSKYLDDVSEGTYKCFIQVIDDNDWGHRVSELHAIKQEVFDQYKDIYEIPYDAEPLNCVIGVDSAQCGIFDAYYYKEHQPDNDYDNINSWYKRVCELTYNAGITDNLGVVSASGYGDGAYGLYVVKDNKKTVAMKVVFIDESDSIEDV